MNQKVLITIFLMAMAVTAAQATETTPAASTTAKGAAAPASPGADTFESPLKLTPQMRQQLTSMGKYYRHFAKSLGCDTLAWGTMSLDGSEVTLKYLPPGSKMTDWTRMTSITVRGLTGNKDKDNALIAKTISDIEGKYMQAGKVNDDQNYVTPDGEHTMFLEYQMGQIYGAAVFMRTGKASVALIELQTNGTPMGNEDILKVHRMVDPQAGVNKAASTVKP